MYLTMSYIIYLTISCIIYIQDNVLLRKRDETESFCSEVEDFTSSYSLIADGQISREQLARQKLIVLRERFENLKQGRPYNRTCLN